MELDLSGIGEPFASMLRPLTQITLRDEITVTQIPSPKGIAPEALAIAAEINHEIRSDHGVSRLVICRDPEEPEGWNSAYRIIGYAKSPVEVHMAKDELMSEMPWEWLKDSLSSKGAKFASEAGTTTTILSTGHGSLVAQPQHAEIEIRASWAPMDSDLIPHVEAWLELLGLISGLPPVQGGIARLA
ncbi:MAG: hypothetical protein RIS51_323 [Actinomycetota bacterium]